MLFNSYTFLFFFLPSFLLVYFSLPGKWRNGVLACFSYIFYGWNEPDYAVLLLSSTLIDYSVALKMPQSQNRKFLLIISIILNLGMLCFFKYYHFFVQNWNWLAAFTGQGLSIENVWAFTVPIGISFYTFQTISYSIDVYRGDVKPERNFIDFACYVSMFPQLIAGPILRFSEVKDTLKSRTVSQTMIATGIGYICCGLFRKVVLGDSCGMMADSVFGTEGVSTLHAWLGLAAFSFQIYFDFSGYSDIAIGLGYMLGFRFPENFNSPYKAASLTDFWHRWHITFSTWLRDYLYIPLGGNKDGKKRTVINLFIVMFLGGLWHGASWNFVLWGVAHGIILGIERLTGFHKKEGFLSTLRTFILVSLLWVFFRSENFPDAMNYFSALFGFGFKEVSQLVTADVLNLWNGVILVVCALVCFLSPCTSEFLKTLNPAKIVYLMTLFMISVYFIYEFDNRLFIYFRF